MKWSEVRTLHPNKFVLLEKLKEHIDLLVRCKGDRFVYHTSKEDLCMEIVNMPILRGRLR